MGRERVMTLRRRFDAKTRAQTPKSRARYFCPHRVGSRGSLLTAPHSHTKRSSTHTMRRAAAAAWAAAARALPPHTRAVGGVPEGAIVFDR